ncbi:MAG TPA: HAMP domain-containing sensor histidine kinase [Alphaproteobacteria bacterium]|nr:HAMP domain-containing sensor histidine kinase [Alphaproteobacteria bacterium]
MTTNTKSIRVGLKLKILLIFLVILLSFIFFSYTNIKSFDAVSESYNHIALSETPKIQALLEMKSISNDIKAQTISFQLLNETAQAEGTFAATKKYELLANMERLEKWVVEFERISLVYHDNTHAHEEHEETEFRDAIQKDKDLIVDLSLELINLKEQGASEELIVNKTRELEKAQDNLRKQIEHEIDNSLKDLARDRKDAEANISKAQILNYYMPFAIALLTISIFFVCIYFIVRPILDLKETASKIAKGELDQHLVAKSRDEIGDLVDTFNDMSIKLKESYISLQEKEKKLEVANKQLQDLDKQKDEFISLTAHELKTPLTSIRGFTQLLQDEAVLSDAEQRNHYIDLINRNTDRLYNLVLDVVDSSRLSLGKLKLNISNVDPAKLFTDIKENMSIVISSKQLTPEFSIEPNLPLIRCDYERTMQVLRNLISNSTKFTQIGSISLKIYRAGDFIRFEVKDTGQGIPKENFNGIFSKFYQVDSSLTRKVGGSGLGLSICKGLIENMGGQIGFDSEVGKGSTFYFTLPVQDNSSEKK